MDAGNPQGEDSFRIYGIQPLSVGVLARSSPTIYASMRPDDGLRNLLLLTAAAGLFKAAGSDVCAAGRTEKYFDVDRVLAAFGNMPGEMIDCGRLRLSSSIENYISNYLKALGTTWTMPGRRGIRGTAMQTPG